MIEKYWNVVSDVEQKKEAFHGKPLIWYQRSNHRLERDFAAARSNGPFNGIPDHDAVFTERTNSMKK